MAVKALFLICALSLPPVTIEGPVHKAAFIHTFDLLIDYAWKRAELRTGERWNAKHAIVIGQDPAIEREMVKAGWALLKPPYRPSTAGLVIYLPRLSGNLQGVDRAVTDMRVWLIAGGYFVLPSFQFDDLMPAPVVDDVMDLIMRGFRNTQFTVQLNQKAYRVWQKRIGRAA